MGIIDIIDLEYTYPNRTRTALSNVSVEIGKGEFIVLVGPSGCGKTTLCRCLNGLIPHFYGGILKGDVVVAGLSIEDNSISTIAQHVGFVFQNPENQLFALSVEKDIAFGLENLGIPRNEIMKQIDWALSITGITELRNRSPHELSGGQQQRVAIAGVLAMKPDVIILDEPTSFLDPLHAVKIFEVIGELNRDIGITIVLIEHRLDLIAKYANRIIVMNEGTIVLDNKPIDVFLEDQYITDLGIPKFVRLYSKLRKQGYPLPNVPMTAEELAQMIREIQI
jgi:energy-coupling factor transporter ATPase